MTLDDMKANAIAAFTARAQASKLASYDERMAGYAAIRAQFADRVCYKGVSVSAIYYKGVSVSASIPENLSTQRKWHYRFQYFFNGKLVGEAAARKALEG